MSIRNDQVHREPAGRVAVGGSGVRSCVVASGAVAVTGRLGLGRRQFAGGGVVVEHLAGTAPLNGGFELTLRFVLAEVLVDEVMEKFGGHRAISFCLEGLFHLT